MRTRIYHSLTFGAALALAGTAAHAQGIPSEFDPDSQTGLVIGAAVTEVAIDDFNDNFDVDTDLDLDDTSWKIFAGWRFNEYFGAELDYMDLGSEEIEEGGTRFDLDARAITAYGVGMWPLPYVDVFAKLGLALWDAEGNTSLAVPGGVDNDFDEDDTEFAWGAGAQARFRNFGVRLEYENFDVAQTDGLDLISLGVTYTFNVGP